MSNLWLCNYYVLIILWFPVSFPNWSFVFLFTFCQFCRELWIVLSMFSHIESVPYWLYIQHLKHLHDRNTLSNYLTYFSRGFSLLSICFQFYDFRSGSFTLSWELPYFLMYTFNAINFPLITALDIYHRIWHSVIFIYFYIFLIL